LEEELDQEHFILCPWVELSSKFDLNRALETGLLPSVFFSDAPYEDLASYVSNYLEQEIRAEGLTRNLPAFSRFLEVAALCNTEIINYSNVSNDAQVPHTTVTEYFGILTDTLIGRELTAWKKTKKRKPLSTSKYYLFDIGVTRYLQGRKTLPEKSQDYGDAFESFIHHELSCYVDYQLGQTLNYWRSTSKHEVDFILDDQVGIEVKAKRNVSQKDLKGIKALKQEALLKHYLVVSLESVARTVDGIQILPWNLFLERLWNQEYK
jgi:predicted AAA+ superfamily ATPase